MMHGLACEESRHFVGIMGFGIVEYYVFTHD